MSGSTTPAATTATPTVVVLCTADPVFAALCQRALAGSNEELVAVATPAELLDCVRLNQPDLLVLDADSEDLSALKQLASKAMLVIDARLVIASGYLAPGSPALCELLQPIAATFVHKPEGPSSLSLTDEDGPRFLAALQAAFAAHEGGEPPAPTAHLPASFDAGWDMEPDLGAPPKPGAR